MYGVEEALRNFADSMGLTGRIIPSGEGFRLETDEPVSFVVLLEKIRAHPKYDKRYENTGLGVRLVVPFSSLRSHPVDVEVSIHVFTGGSPDVASFTASLKQARLYNEYGEVEVIRSFSTLTHRLKKLSEDRRVEREARIG